MLQLLLVEDEEAHAELVARAFEAIEDVELTRAEKLSVARGFLSQTGRSFDLVVTDLRLPDGLGIELIEPERPPVVVMTSQGDEKAAVEAMKAGAIDYVVKSETTFADMPRISERALREWRLLKEQQRLRLALDQHERLAAVGTAAAMLAHEIGNPLNSMALHAELLGRRLKKLAIDDAQVNKQIANCTGEIRRLVDLLQDFRALSNKQELERTSVDVAELIRGVVERYEVSVYDAGTEIALELTDDLGILELDADKMKQVLLNLLKNAAEAMDNGGSIRVEARRDREIVTLVVSDSGPGIPHDIDVFEPFRSTKAGGSGLGLPIVQRIVAAHAGTITHSDNTPCGTRFEIVLPVKAPAV